MSGRRVSDKQKERLEKNGREYGVKCVIMSVKL